MDAGSPAEEIVLAAATHPLAVPSFATTVPSSLSAATSKKPVAAPVAPPRMRVEGPPQIVQRGSDAIFTVTLSSAPGLGKTIKVHYVTVNGGARAGVQYVKTSGDLVFTGFETSKTIAVPTIPESPSRYPKQDNFSLKLSAPTRGTKLTVSSAIARIAPVIQGVSVANVAVLEGDTGTTPAVFAISLGARSSVPVSVQYATVDGSATAADRDYVPAAGTLTFAPGETVRYLEVAVVGDTFPETDEVFALNLISATSVPVLTKSAQAYILDDDLEDNPSTRPDMVSVGDVGNPSDPATGLGRVEYSYRIAKYETTVGQYVAFLNAKARADLPGPYPAQLYNSDMPIARSGAPGSYSYTSTVAANLPMSDVTWFDMVRYANWMNNGQGDGDTETGAYHIRQGAVARAERAPMTVGGTGGMNVTTRFPHRVRVGDQVAIGGVDGAARSSDRAGLVTAVDGFTFTVDFPAGEMVDTGTGGYYIATPMTRSSNAVFWIPSQNEWYKAAYYDPLIGIASSNYWAYATRSDLEPGNAVGAASNNANVSGGSLTPVGAFSGSQSYYGTFDQTGNVSEVTETLPISSGSTPGKVRSSRRVLMGGDSESGIVSSTATKDLYATDWGTNSFYLGLNGICRTRWSGFRLAGSGDSAAVGPQVSVSNASVVEGHSGTRDLVFNVSLSAVSTKTVVVRYATADWTATTADGDYVGQSGFILFAPGEVQKQIVVKVNGDVNVEVNETLSLVLSRPVNAMLKPPAGTGTILNDDSSSLVSSGDVGLSQAATAMPRSPFGQAGAFQITLDYTTSPFGYGAVPDRVRRACEDAASVWQQVITGDLPDVVDPATGMVTDDLRIQIQIGLNGFAAGTDGKVGSNTLAQAGPLENRANSGLPWLATAQIDPANLDDPGLVGILVHEFGHALGFGASPAFQRLVAGTEFVGMSARTEFGAIFGTNATGVPLEPQGGPGTAGSHWSEAVLGAELMTGFVDSVMPLSRITIAAMQDLGYSVNYAAADAFAPPATSAIRVAGAAVGVLVGQSPDVRLPGKTADARIPSFLSAVSVAELAVSTVLKTERSPSVSFADQQKNARPTNQPRRQSASPAHRLQLGAGIFAALSRHA